MVDWSSVFEKAGAEFTSAFGGATLHRPNGNLDGRGRNLTWENTLELSFKPVKNWQIKVGGGALQYFRPADPKNPFRRELEILDPFIGLARKRLFQTNLFDLETRARYYFPMSDATKASVGRANDKANGRLNLGAFPVFHFLDGDLTLAAPSVELNYYFDRNAAANRENYAVKATANLAYQLTRKLSTSAEYTTGNLRHNNAGHLNKLRGRQRVAASLAYLPAESLTLTQTLTWGANNSFRLNRAEYGLSAAYRFL